ncbi:MAG: sigma-70 family RNA polymerase sigma factor [Bryobacteraceae bacterium]|nr:sigma-70 family RNA polymerase sigma factor [Bryobacteraceae bacterium]
MAVTPGIDDSDAYRIVAATVRTICLRLARPVDQDVVHDTYVVLLDSVRNGSLRDGTCLRAFAHTVAWRLVWKSIYAGRRKVATVREVEVAPVEAGSLEAEERQQILHKALSGMRERDREILSRFYLLNQPWQRICTEMSLNERQFRQYKSRAKQLLTQRVAELDR